MGIDFLDVHDRLEQRFGIRLDTDERFYLLRAGWIRFLVKEKLHGINPPIPDTRAILERISDALSAAPDESGWFGRLFYQDFASRIPAAVRREHWRRIEDRLGLRLPPLRDVPSEAAPRFPQDCATIGQLLSWVAFTYRNRLPQKNPGGTSSRPAGADTWTDTTLWAAIQDVLVDALNVDRTLIIPEAWLIEDLGAA